MSNNRKTNVVIAIALCVLASLLCVRSMSLFPSVKAEAVDIRYFGGADCYAAWTAQHTYSRDQNTDHCTYAVASPIKGTMVRHLPIMDTVDAPIVHGTSTTSDVVVVTPPTTVVVVVVVTPAPTQDNTCKSGNPGNHKCVGHAGEDPNNKGTMDNDSTDGNGEHGNQNVGNPNK